MFAGAGRLAFTWSLGGAAGSRLATSRYAATRPRLRTSTATFSSAARLQYLDMDDRMNEGLILQHQLQAAGHEKWGFAIFRCTYADDAAWRRFMAIVNTRTRASLEYYGTPELLHSLEWSVQEDPSSLDGAGTDVVRRRFAEWVAGAMRREANASRGFATRFQYCLHVDAAALKSVVHDAPQPPDPDLGNVGFVNVVDLTGRKHRFRRRVVSRKMSRRLKASGRSTSDSCGCLWTVWHPGRTACWPRAAGGRYGM